MFNDLLFIALFVVSLGGGAASVLLAHRFQKYYDLPFLRSYLYYLILVFIFGMYGVLGTLLVRSQIAELASPIQLMQNILNFLPFLGVPFLVTGWYMFIKMFMELTGNFPSRYFTGGYFGLFLLVFLAYGLLVVNIFSLEEGSEIHVSTLIKMVLIALEVVTVVVAYGHLFSHMTQVQDPGFRQAIFRFSQVVLILRLAGMMLFYLSDRSVAFAMIYTVLFFTGNMIPLLYLGGLLEKFHVPHAARGNIQPGLKDLLAAYHISNRELEIIEKICDGHTNQQISEALFISLQTVKDHTHRIYKKIGVKNRIHLVNLIRNLQQH